jgi:gas vesicle protein
MIGDRVVDYFDLSKLDNKFCIIRSIEMKRSSGVPLISFLIGAVFGAIMALLYAPVSGEELRGQIREEADVRLQQVSEEWDKALKSMQKALDDTSNEIKGYIKQAQAEEEVEIQEEV